MRYAKQRGQSRRAKSLLSNIDRITPYADTGGRYEHFHVPCGPFISSPKTSGTIKTDFCRAWLEKTALILEQKPKELSFCKVVALIDTADLWESQIIIFYDESYYREFWSRDSEEQTWTPLSENNGSFAKARNMKTSLKEKGYLELRRDEGVSRRSVLWFYGDVP
jgi:hypothetical protein